MSKINFPSFERRKNKIRLNFIVELLTKAPFHLHLFFASLSNKCLISYELMLSENDENKAKDEQGIPLNRGSFRSSFISMQSK